MKRTKEEIRALAAEQDKKANEWLKNNFTEKEFLQNEARAHNHAKLMSIARAL